jgi:adenine-specific DNA-methyltransferase
MTLSRHYWPLVVAHSYAENLDRDAKDKLLESRSYSEILNREGANQQLEKCKIIANELKIPNLREAEKLLEGSLTDEVKKENGAVYTPPFIVDYILKVCLDSLGHQESPTTVLDPACGSGGFLLGALRQVNRLTGRRYSSISKDLFGLDVNQEAVQNARLLLDLACLEQSGELSQSTIIQCDSLLTPVEEQLDLINHGQGVSILATNPPYVKLQTLPQNYRALLIDAYPNLASGAFSLATFFIGNATKYLKKDGVAGFITLNNLFTSLSGRPLRQEWQANREVFRIVDFRHFALFEASAYTCLIFLNQKERVGLEFCAVNEMPTESTLEAMEFSLVPYAGLKDHKWRLASENNLNLVNRLETKGTKLKVAAEIRVGLATLFDKAYVCDRKAGEYFASGSDGVVRRIEDGIVEKFIKVSELSESSSVYSVQRGIIYPYSKVSDARELLTWGYLQEHFPNAAAHLLSWQERLLRRSGVEETTWYQWGRRQGMISEPRKLFTKTFDKKPTFYLDESDGLFANGYSVRPSDPRQGYSIDQLKSFLESRFMYAYSLVTSFEIQGGYQCYQKNFIENICLPPKELIPDYKGSGIPAGSNTERRIAEFYGFPIDHLEACLSSYLN